MSVPTSYLGNQDRSSPVQTSEQLVDLARAGDRQAFTDLCLVHQHEVFNLALRLTANRELAADVAQETLIRAWRSLPGFRGDAAFSTWLHRITVNTAWTSLRKWKEKTTNPLETVIDLTDPRFDDDAMVVFDIRSHIKSAVERLPSGQRAVVVLKDIYGWSHAEVAESLGITVTACKVRLHRAHQRLASVLENVEV